MLRPLRLLAITLPLATSVACGDDDAVGAGGGGGSPAPTTTTSTSTGDQGGGGEGGRGQGGGGPSCVEPDAPGASFTLRFQNDLDRDLHVSTGCGDVPQVTLEVTDVDARIDPESGDFCGFVCERLLDDGDIPGGCSDCGPGGWLVVPAGEGVDHVWDRRVYRPALVTDDCTGLGGDFECAFAEQLDEGTYPARVEACDDVASGPCDGEYVSSTAVVDLSGDVAVFVFGP